MNEAINLPSLPHGLDDILLPNGGDVRVPGPSLKSYLLLKSWRGYSLYNGGYSILTRITNKICKFLYIDLNFPY